MVLKIARLCPGRGPDATMTADDGNGAKPMTNGKPSQPLEIDSSKTSSTFFVVVTAPDGTTKKTYT